MSDQAYDELARLAKNHRILVVDDEPSIQELLSIILELDGHEVVVAPDGPTALRMVRSEHFDLVTLDVMMPGMDGWAVADELDADPELSLIPRVMVSGKPLPELTAAPGAPRASAILSKPFDFVQFTQIVADLLAPREHAIEIDQQLAG